MKQFRDFNDLANKSALGQEGIDRQARSLLGDVMEEHRRVRVEQQRLDRSQAAVENVMAERPKDAMRQKSRRSAPGCS